ncbi:MAG: phosphoribosyl-AMP cyclohydrolase [Alphaproteobacteria bacterium]|nr:phosphoribosyl-AMP cyclohydrolase [Alphaproteobacteria bacterium]
MDKKELEDSLKFLPRFDAQGLIPCITTSARSGKVLMLAYMNEEALKKSLETGEAHYWSRSRGELWHKGASSGHVQRIIEMRVDCDQDCVWISVDMDEEASCHTGRRSCFYRKVVKNEGGSPALEWVDEDLLFDPETVYKK